MNLPCKPRDVDIYCLTEKSHKTNHNLKPEYWGLFAQTKTDGRFKAIVADGVGVQIVEYFFDMLRITQLT